MTCSRSKDIIVYLYFFRLNFKQMLDISGFVFLAFLDRFIRNDLYCSLEYTQIIEI